MAESGVGDSQRRAAKGAVVPDAAAILAGDVRGDGRVGNGQCCADTFAVIVDRAAVVTGVPGDRAIADGQDRAGALAVVVNGAAMAPGIPVGSDGAIADGQSRSVVVNGGAATGPNISVGQGQPGDRGVGAALYEEDAKRERAGGTAALNRRAVSVDGQRMTPIGTDLRQSVDGIVSDCERVCATGRKFNRIVLSVAVGRRDGVLESDHVAIGDGEDGGAQRLPAKEQQSGSNQAAK